MSQTENQKAKEGIAVLVADDDPIFRSLAVARLQLMGGRAVEAPDGQDAWNLLMSRSFDLAIVDLSMPNLDGFDLIRWMRRHQRTRHLPIIVVTSRHDEKAIETALEVGATAFLTKPVNWSTFGNYIGVLLRLAATDRRSRSDERRSRVIARVHETLLDNLSDEIAGAASGIRHCLSLASTAGLDSGHDAVIRALADRGLGKLRHLEAVAETVDKLSRRLSDEIAVADRKEDINGIISRAVAKNEPNAKVAGVALVNETAIADVVVACDASSIEVVVGQLLCNAIAHSKSGASVIITHKLYDDGTLAVEVSDTGTGMHPDLIGRALDGRQVIIRLGQDTKPTGFGLPLAKAIAEAHGGALEIRSMVGQGTSAILVFPPERVFENSIRAA